MEPDVVTSLCLADFEDAAYIIAVLAFTVFSWVIGFVKKRAQEKEGGDEPSSDEMFEQAELVEDEPNAHPGPMQSFKRRLPEPAKPRIPSPPPLAKPTGLPPPRSVARASQPAHESFLAAQVPVVTRSRQDISVALDMPESGIVYSTTDAMKPDSTGTPSSATVTPSPPAPGAAGGRSRWGTGFHSINAVRRAIVMAEVLGPPVSCREYGRCPGDSDSAAP